ncbi:MAG: phage baseplate protein [Flavobacterium sp.]
MFNQIPTADQITNTLGVTNSLVNQYIVAPVQGLGIAGFKLSITKIEESEFDSDVTDYFVEDNSSRQNHIALKPEMYTIQGQIGELVYLKIDKVGTLGKATAKLTQLNAYLPTLSDSVSLAQAAITDAQTANSVSGYINSSVTTGVDLYQTFKRLNPPSTNQAKGYNYFLALRNARQLISFETPWGFKSNYVIKNFKFTQPEKTDGLSEVVLVMKEYRKAVTRIVPFDAAKFQNRAAGQQSSIIDKGTSSGVKVDFNTQLQSVL